jgi:dihydroorotate dehydrogenase electron transfer subunit
MLEQESEIIFNREMVPATFLMGLHSPALAAQAAPGQFVMLRVARESDPLLRRPFSICATRESLVLLLYRVAGRGTAMLARLPHGERLSALGPLGRGFVLPQSGQKVLLAAGGVGLAPLTFLALALDGRPRELLIGYPSAAESLPLEELGLQNLPVSLATDDGTLGHRGPVTDLVAARLEKAAQDIATLYACGPLPMLKKVAALAERHAVPCQVALETAMACGLGACQGCVVPSRDRPFYHRVCREGPVFSTADLDWENL